MIYYLDFITSYIKMNSYRNSPIWNIGNSVGCPNTTHVWNIIDDCPIEYTIIRDTLIDDMFFSIQDRLWNNYDIIVKKIHTDDIDIVKICKGIYKLLPTFEGFEHLDKELLKHTLNKIIRKINGIHNMNAPRKIICPKGYLHLNNHKPYIEFPNYREYYLFIRQK